MTEQFKSNSPGVTAWELELRILVKSLDGGLSITRLECSFLRRSILVVSFDRRNFLLKFFLSDSREGTHKVHFEFSMYVMSRK